MDTNTMIVVAVLIVAVAAILALLLTRKRQSTQLRSHFGPEYDQAVEATGDKKHAERELHAREKRVAKFEAPLSPPSVLAS